MRKVNKFNNNVSIDIHRLRKRESPGPRLKLYNETYYITILYRKYNNTFKQFFKTSNISLEIPFVC